MVCDKFHQHVTEPVLQGKSPPPHPTQGTLDPFFPQVTNKHSHCLPLHWDLSTAQMLSFRNAFFKDTFLTSLIGMNTMNFITRIC